MVLQFVLWKLYELYIKILESEILILKNEASRKKLAFNYAKIKSASQNHSVRLALLVVRMERKTGY